MEYRMGAMHRVDPRPLHPVAQNRAIEEALIAMVRGVVDQADNQARKIEWASLSLSTKVDPVFGLTLTLGAVAT